MMRTSAWILATAVLALAVLRAGGETSSASGQNVTIKVTEVPGSYVVIYPDGKADPGRAAVLIGKSMEHWLREHPRKVRASTSVVSGGNTIALYLWCEPAPGGRQAKTP
jgi:hypothetical protein